MIVAMAMRVITLMMMLMAMTMRVITLMMVLVMMMVFRAPVSGRLMLVVMLVMMVSMPPMLVFHISVLTLSLSVLWQ